MNLRLAVCIALAGHCLAGTALAQPALERVEQKLRKDTAVRPAAADDAPENKNAGYLGILGDDRQDNGKGVRVTRTDNGGPAAKAGLKAGDLITAIDDQPIKSMEEMGEIMITRHAGAMVKFSIERDGTTSEVPVRLERRPPPEKRLAPQFGKQSEEMPPPGGPAPGGAAGPVDPGSSTILRTRRPKLGISTVHVSPYIREKSRLPGSYVTGVFVTQVDPDSPAGKAGLPNNSIITSVDGEPMDSPDTLAALVSRTGPGQTMNVTYYFRDHETQLAITLAGGPQQQPAAGGQPTVRAKPMARPPVVPEQPPGFAPDETDAPDLSPPAGNVEKAGNTDKIAELERRIGELEKRVAELEAAAIIPGADAGEK